MANLSDEGVKKQFVVRKDEFEDVMSEIRRNKMTGSIQHYVFVGQRGSGKSTLLRRIQAEVNTDQKLGSRLIAINLSEEQAGIYRLHDLWGRVCQELEIQGLTVEELDWKVFDGDMTAYARALYLSMQKALKKSKRKLVLLLDNIDRIFESIKEDKHLFRELLMNHKDVRIIGGSTRLSEHHWKYDEPFYEFFSIFRLKSLSKEEVGELLISWSELFDVPSLREFVEKNEGKLEAIRILSDGMPRTMLHLLDLLINEPEKNGYDYLSYIVDRATPIYQERLGTLSPSLQKVVLELSFFWDAIKVKELAEATKMESKTVSAMLKQLVEMQIVELVRGKGRNHFYRLQERFFNLWLVMTQGGPRQKSQVKWLTIFLETWYDAEGVKAYYRKVKDGLPKMTPNQAILMAKALVHSKFISLTERDDLLESVKSHLDSNPKYLETLPKNSLAILSEAIQLTDNKKYNKALQLLNQIEQEDGLVKGIQGIVYARMKNYEQAEKILLRAVGLGSKESLLNLGALYLEIEKYDLAINYLLLSKENGFDKVYSLLGEAYVLKGRYEEAIDEFHEGAKIKQIDAISHLFTAVYMFSPSVRELKELFKVYSIPNSESEIDQIIAQLIYLYMGRFDLFDAKKLLKLSLSNDDSNTPDFPLLELLVHHQTEMVIAWFEEGDQANELRDKFKVPYYVALLFSNENKEEQGIRQE